MIQNTVRPVPQLPQSCQPIVLPSYNAVKIDIHHPEVNAPGFVQSPIQAPNYTAPMYQYPQANIYDVPEKSIYKKEEEPVENQPKSVKEAPIVPPPVVVPTEVKAADTVTVPVETIAPVEQVAPVVPTPNEPVAVVAPVSETASKGVESTVSTEQAVPVAAPTTPVLEATPVIPAGAQADAKSAEVPAEVVADVAPKTVDVKAPEAIQPKIDLNEFINKLMSPDYEVQAKTMESIAAMAITSPEKASELLDVKVFDTLLGIMQTDTSKLAGPTAQQIEARQKIMGGKPVTEAETAEANKVTPMELAERNKQFAIYTIASLEKLYISEIEKLSNSVVPLTELPGAAGIVEQVKNNPNPMIRLSAIDALSYIQKPEYKNDLTTLFTVAQKDSDAIVQQVATKALEKVSKLPEPTVTAGTAPVNTTLAAEKPVENSTPVPVVTAEVPATEVKPEEVKKSV